MLPEPTKNDWLVVGFLKGFLYLGNLHVSASEGLRQGQYFRCIQTPVTKKRALRSLCGGPRVECPLTLSALIVISP